MKKLLIIFLLLSLTIVGCSEELEGLKEKYDEIITKEDTSGEIATDDVKEKYGSASMSKRSIKPGQDSNYNQEIDPEPGQLTAGEWNDNEHFDFLLDLLNKEEYRSLFEARGFNNFQRMKISIINQNGDPIYGEKVEIYSNDRLIYIGRTDNKGLLYAYYSLEKYVDESGYAMINNKKYDLQKELNIVIDKEKTELPLDLMFVIDTTGSMTDEMNYLQSELKYVIKEVDPNNMRISVNFYKDLEDEYISINNPFIESVSDSVNLIKNERASGGGDFEEAVEIALKEGISHHNWRKDSNKLLFLVLDAPCHNTDTNRQIIMEQIKKANEMGIKIIPIASSGIDKDTEMFLRALSFSTSGTYVFLTDDSGIGGSHIEPTIGEYQIEYLNKLLIKIIKRFTS